MLDRELTYQMPFARLLKLSRSASRKAFGSSWYLTWSLVVGYFAMLGALVFFADEIGRLERQFGIPWWLWFAGLIAALLVGLFTLRRHARGLMRSRADYDSTVRFKEDADGLRFATPQVEYFIKWNGISQMIMEPDGVAFSHGSLFFLVPNTAFASTIERDALVRDVFARLNEAARERSETFIRPVLDASANTAGI